MHCKTEEIVCNSVRTSIQCHLYCMNLQGLIFAPNILCKTAGSWYWFWPHLAAVLKDHEVLFFHIVMVSYLQWIAMLTWFKFCSNWTLMSVSLTALRSHFVCVCCTITCLSSSTNCPIYCNLLINGSEISSSDLLSNDDAYRGRRERGRSVNDWNGWYENSILWNNAQVCHQRCNLPGSPHTLINFLKSPLQSL